ncbi:MAG: hypothetical protein QW756_02125 [Nitrososphaerota archaeon]
MKAKTFKGNVYSEGDGRLKIVIPNNISFGRCWVAITRIDGRNVDITFKATVTKNTAATNKFRLKGLNIRPGSTVQGWIRLAEDRPKKDGLRCRWCGQVCSALINDLCDRCFLDINAPRPNPQRAYARGMVGHRPQAKHPNPFLSSRMVPCLGFSRMWGRAASCPGYGFRRPTPL